MKIVSCFILTLCLTEGLHGQQEPYRFGVRVQTVFVDVFVSDDGKPVLDLGPENFEVLDNGVRQEFELVDVGTTPTSAMLVLDVSGSVAGLKLRHLRKAAHAFVEGLEDVDEAGLITVTQELHLAKRLDNDFPALHHALDQPMEGGATALVDALFAGLKLLETAKGRPMLLLFTDGMDNMSWLSESDVLEVVKATEAIIYIVGVRSRGGVHQFGRPVGGAGQANRFFETMAQSTGGQVWFADSSDALEDVFLGILEEMGTRYLLSFQPRGAPKEGWHELEVRLKGRKASNVRARSSYVVPKGQQLPASNPQNSTRRRDSVESRDVKVFFIEPVGTENIDDPEGCRRKDRIPIFNRRKRWLASPAANSPFGCLAGGVSFRGRSRDNVRWRKSAPSSCDPDSIRPARLSVVPSRGQSPRLGTTNKEHHRSYFLGFSSSLFQEKENHAG